MKTQYLLGLVAVVSASSALLAQNIPTSNVGTKRHIEKTAFAHNKQEKPWYKVYEPKKADPVSLGCCDYPRAPAWCPVWRIGQAHPYDHVEVRSSDDYLLSVSMFGPPRCHEVIEFPSQRIYYEDY